MSALSGHWTVTTGDGPRHARVEAAVERCGRPWMLERRLLRKGGANASLSHAVAVEP
jgi:hypothetical protein